MAVSLLIAHIISKLLYFLTISSTLSSEYQLLQISITLYFSKKGITIFITLDAISNFNIFYHIAYI